VALFSSELGIKKPDPEIYLKACQLLGVEPQRCLYVGDGGSHELSGASELGMDALLLDVPGEEFGEEFRPDAQDWQGPSVEALAQVVPIALSGSIG
jgi:putative hydrolase of the HAD superfamily